MSLLNLGKKNTAVKPAPKKERAGKVVATLGVKHVSGKMNPGVLVRPHITEKAAASAEKGVYVFNVSLHANKLEIARAVALFYKVNPIKVTIVAIPKKRITVKGRPGFRKGGKKAYVFLKKGEKIELM
ncbi:MAG: 50S ribosomal protein L23 [bacterium]|nr:50S ribosomal protein L23 [bacterium]